MPIGEAAASVLGPVIGGLIGGGSSVAVANLQAKQSAINLGRQIDWAREQQQSQQLFDMAQIEKQNLYNSPMAQMKRLRQAGLNPNLIYGQPQAMGLQTQTAKYQQVHPDFSQQKAKWTGIAEGAQRAMGGAREFLAYQMEARQLKQKDLDLISQQVETEIGLAKADLEKIDLALKGAMRYTIVDGKIKMVQAAWADSTKEDIKGREIFGKKYRNTTWERGMKYGELKFEAEKATMKLNVATATTAKKIAELRSLGVNPAEDSEFPY